MRSNLTLAQRFWQKVNKTDTCWLWFGAKNSDGYGYFRMGGRGVPMVRAHAWAYVTLVGSIPKGLQLDHLCRVRNCVRPDHLEPVTSWVNQLRSPLSITAKNAQKLYCVNGHPLLPGRTQRKCPICLAAARDRYRARLAGV